MQNFTVQFQCADTLTFDFDLTSWLHAVVVVVNTFIPAQDMLADIYRHMTRTCGVNRLESTGVSPHCGRVYVMAFAGMERKV